MLALRLSAETDFGVGTDYVSRDSVRENSVTVTSNL